MQKKVFDAIIKYSPPDIHKSFDEAVASMPSEIKVKFCLLASCIFAIDGEIAKKRKTIWSKCSVDHKSY